jgi:hypothetical protein
MEVASLTSQALGVLVVWQGVAALVEAAAE